MTKIRLEWEDLEQDTAGHIQRAAIPGGWLVRQVDDVCSDYTGKGTESGYEWRTSMTFVPDPDHVWGHPERQHSSYWHMINDQLEPRVKTFNPVVEMLKGASATIGFLILVLIFGLIIDYLLRTYTV